MSKILTEKLIHERLEDKGISVPHETPFEDQLKAICKYYDAEFVHDFGKHANIFFYEESSADGYTVYIATENENAPYVCDDVYMYESDRFSKLGEAITSGYIIYIDKQELYSGDYTIEEEIGVVYEEWYMENYEEMENELLDDGYDWPKTEG